MGVCIKDGKQEVLWLCSFPILNTSVIGKVLPEMTVMWKIMFSKRQERHPKPTLFSALTDTLTFWVFIFLCKSFSFLVFQQQRIQDKIPSFSCLHTMTDVKQRGGITYLSRGQHPRSLHNVFHFFPLQVNSHCRGLPKMFNFSATLNGNGRNCFGVEISRVPLHILLFFFFFRGFQWLRLL